MISSNDDTLGLCSVTSSYNEQGSEFSWAVSFVYTEVLTEVYCKDTRTHNRTLHWGSQSVSFSMSYDICFVCFKSLHTWHLSSRIFKQKFYYVFVISLTRDSYHIHVDVITLAVLITKQLLLMYNSWALCYLFSLGFQYCLRHRDKRYCIPCLIT